MNQAGGSPRPEQWFSLWILDHKDEIGREPEVERQRTLIAALHREFRGALDRAYSSIGPSPWLDPANDTWDDDIVFRKAPGTFRVTDKQRAVTEAEQQFAELMKTEEPIRDIAPAILRDVHGYLEDMGLVNRPDRRHWQPVSLGGRTLAEVLWEARNQDQHFRGGVRPPVIDCFRDIVSSGGEGVNEGVQPEARTGGGPRG